MLATGFINILIIRRRIFFGVDYNQSLATKPWVYRIKKIVFSETGIKKLCLKENVKRRSKFPSSSHKVQISYSSAF